VHGQIVQGCYRVETMIDPKPTEKWISTKKQKSSMPECVQAIFMEMKDNMYLC
jgi:hypothetical protein